MNRRSFLHVAATAVGAASCAGHSLTPLARPLHKKSLKFGMIREDLSILDKFKLVKSLGFDGVEMDSPNELNIEEVIEAAATAGIEIPGVVNSVHWQNPMSHPDPEVRKACTDSMVLALNECRDLGGSTVLLVPGVVNEEIRYDQAWDRSTEEIKKLIPVAMDTGVKIAIENVWNNFLISPLEAARFVDQFESDMIGWYFDVGNVVRYGWPEHWIRILAHRILKIDVKEYSRTKQQEEGIWKGFDVELGEGDSDWEKVNRALAEIGYSGWGSAEVRGGDRERLKEISDRMDRIFAL